MNLRWVLHITGAGLLIISGACEQQGVRPDVVVYGHAGTSLYPERWVYPANTLESVLYALDVLDADGVEVDVQMTKDSVLVLYHDPMLDEITNLTGCIPLHTYQELESRNVYHSRYKLAKLEDALAVCMARQRKIFLDLKPFNFCTGEDINHKTFDNALNGLLEKYSPEQRALITCNTRNFVLLENLTDTCIITSFETGDSLLAQSVFENGTADEICLQYSSNSSELVDFMRTRSIPFTFFGIKTKKEIDHAVDYQPKSVITDNIAYTCKVTD